MNKMNLICAVAFATLASASVVAGPGGGGTPPGGGGNQPGGNQPGGGASATWTFDTFLASATTTSGLIIREGAIIGYNSPTSATVASTVTDIAEGALAGCTTLTSIDLSATSITEIPESAFAGCSNLATVILPSTCTTIGANAFAGCTKLTTLTAPGVTTVGNDSFRACSALPVISSVVRAAGAFSFAQSGVTSVDLTGMTSVGEGAFAGCESLTTATVASGATLPDALFAGCTALNVGDWSGVTSFGQAALAGIPATTLTLSDSASLGAYALAADEATIVTTLSEATVPAHDATAFLGREVSYTPVAGSVARLEAMALVTWLQEQAADSSSAVVQPTSYNTADLETWLDTASNLSAIYAFCWAERYAADAGFQPLTVSGTSFLFTAPDVGTTGSLAVTVVGTTDLTDAAGFTVDALAEAGTADGVTTYVSSDAAASCFARLRFAKGW